jgi:hypothetical protein
MGGSAISGHLPVVRCLPTVASAVRSGVTVYTRGRFCNDADVKPFLTLFSLVGHCEEVAEKLQDSFSGFSGAGIAFVSPIYQYRLPHNSHAATMRTFLCICGLLVVLLCVCVCVCVCTDGGGIGGYG